MTGQNRKTVVGSERSPLPGAKVVGDADPNERILVTVRLKRKTPLGAPQAEMQPMSRAEYANRHGADPAAIKSVEDFAGAHRLQVVESSSGRRSVILSGTASAFSAAFNVQLKRYSADEGKITYRGREGPVTIPSDLADIVEAVMGLDNRPQAKPHFRKAESAAATRTGTAKAFTPPEVARIYHFPNLDGSGQCIALIELGGSYSQNDFAQYCQRLKVPMPNVSVVSVDGAPTNPPPSDPDVEVMLDVEVAGTIAPKAHIVVYFADNTDRGFLDAITTALHDNTNKPSVISISWGGAESLWTRQAMETFDSSFQTAVALGVTVCCASGDDGSRDGVNDQQPHVDFPASSPYALGCGGTRLQATADMKIANEVVWNSNGASGGGVSTMFALPSWQSTAGVPTIKTNGNRHKGRGVPDICGDADTQTGYDIRAQGQDIIVGGTSAVAPLWAALIALINQKRGSPVGYINPKLYQLPGYQTATSPLHDVQQGSNGDFTAKPGWDACTGLGSPDGSRLLATL